MIRRLEDTFAEKEQSYLKQIQSLQ